jgi:hypothetical protein
MKIEKIDIAAAGTWARDCELLCLSDCKGFKISYHRDEDDTYWSLQCKGIVAYKVMGEEFSTTGYLINPSSVMSQRARADSALHLELNDRFVGSENRR